MVPSTETVLTWLAAVNAGDTEEVLSHTAPEVMIVGPRGTAHGREVLRSWLGHSGATFTTRAVYGHGNAVVVTQRGVWRDTATGKVSGEAEVVTRFLVSGSQVVGSLYSVAVSL